MDTSTGHELMYLHAMGTSGEGWYGLLDVAQ
jgi:hypothetical protein